jgi:hypothetical protein
MHSNKNNKYSLLSRFQLIETQVYYVYDLRQVSDFLALMSIESSDLLSKEGSNK